MYCVGFNTGMKTFCLNLSAYSLTEVLRIVAVNTYLLFVLLLIAKI